ncbi:hypothetical protein J7I84_11615 [Arthrobacter sp. ISL-85]|uniref:hypothetical protein n=1 Tax=Arthrobacter sp. ISL-85 TaxID=2819115 RepID=UPI001BEA5100|nr:hypothetical protein [Arthrobacter sp. ISL-85]MBT2567130.1 hypothetical protein [Arthrobacter sp. ISL-85]
MAHSQIDQFLQEATCPDHESGRTLDNDTLYGLYTSWCQLSQQQPQDEHIFFEAMSQSLRPGQCLRMMGPAAADYILCSYRAVV